MVWAVICFISGQFLVASLFLFFFLIGLCYIKVVWSRIPLATANLVTSLTAIKANFGVIFVSYFMTFVGTVWAVIWTIGMAGLYQKLCGDVDCNSDNYPYGQLFGMLVPYFWTLQVVMNVVHVTVAGVVSTWWFFPDQANSCCSVAILGSFIRTLTTSFGSICLGSLIVAIIQALRALADAARQNDDGGSVLVCLADCILACIQGIVEYFNKWAFIYVGVYGYSYCEAGKNVMKLFEDRGWDVIIADDLVGNTILLMSFVIGLVTGAVGYILSITTDWFNEFENQTQTTGTAEYGAFLIGFIIGLMLSLIMLTAVASGVNTVIVCFADAPAEFQTNHPELSNRMRQTYRSAFP